MDLRILFVDIWTVAISHLLSLLLLLLSCAYVVVLSCVDIPSCMYVSWLVFLFLCGDVLCAPWICFFHVEKGTLKILVA
jgi:hypothetical protein